MRAIVRVGRIRGGAGLPLFPRTLSAALVFFLLTQSRTLRISRNLNLNLACLALVMVTWPEAA